MEECVLHSKETCGQFTPSRKTKDAVLSVVDCVWELSRTQ